MQQLPMKYILHLTIGKCQWIIDAQCSPHPALIAFNPLEMYPELGILTLQEMDPGHATVTLSLQPQAHVLD